MFLKSCLLNSETPSRHLTFLWPLRDLLNVTHQTFWYCQTIFLVKVYGFYLFWSCAKSLKSYLIWPLWGHFSSLLELIYSNGPACVMSKGISLYYFCLKGLVLLPGVFLFLATDQDLRLNSEDLSFIRSHCCVHKRCLKKIYIEKYIIYYESSELMRRLKCGNRIYEQRTPYSGTNT